MIPRRVCEIELALRGLNMIGAPAAGPIALKWLGRWPGPRPANSSICRSGFRQPFGGCLGGLAGCRHLVDVPFHGAWLNVA